MLSRLKFEIGPLVEQMLDQLPQSVFESDNTTFFDPAMGGGQFVAAIERRLREHGHSEKNIEKRVYFCEKYEGRVNYAINAHGIIGQYWVGDVLEMEFNTDFDVVICNPPYKNGMWKKFLKRSIELSTEHVCIVAPDGITPYSTSRKSVNLKTMLMDGGIQKVFPVTEYFPSVSSGEISVYVLNTTKVGNKAAFEKSGIDHNIVEKVLSAPGGRLDGILASQMATYWGMEKSDTPKKGFKKVLSAVTTTGCEFVWVKGYKNKHVSKDDYWFSNRFFGSSKQMALMELDEDVTLGQNVLAVKKLDGYTIDLFKTVYNSRLFRFVLEVIKNGKFDTPISVIKMLPILPARKWDEKEVFNYFKLTKNEIKLIEDTIK